MQINSKLIPSRFVKQCERTLLRGDLYRLGIALDELIGNDLSSIRDRMGDVQDLYFDEHLANVMGYLEKSGELRYCLNDDGYESDFHASPENFEIMCDYVESYVFNYSRIDEDTGETITAKIKNNDTRALLNRLLFPLQYLEEDGYSQGYNDEYIIETKADFEDWCEDVAIYFKIVFTKFESIIEFFKAVAFTFKDTFTNIFDIENKAQLIAFALIRKDIQFYMSVDSELINKFDDIYRGFELHYNMKMNEDYLTVDKSFRFLLNVMENENASDDLLLAIIFGNCIKEVLQCN